MYEFLLYNRNGQLMADISSLVYSVNWSRQRNEAETLTFTVNIDMLENLGTGSNPRSLLAPYTTQVLVKRDGTALFLTEVASLTATFDINTNYINVSCWGLLNLFKDRYVSFSVEQMPMGEIAWSAVDYTQLQTNGSQGITRGTEQWQGKPRDRTYERTNVKTLLQNLTNLSDETIDFEFTYDKKFNVYSMIGSERTDVSFIYPQNIIMLNVPRDATSLYNKVYGLGSGFGDDQVTSTQSDTASQALFGVRENTFIQNSVVLDDTLEENTRNYLARHSEVLEIPQITLKGKDIDLNSIIPGDRVPVQVKDHSFVDNIDGFYRIERIEVAVDENDDEDVKLYFDNFGLEN